MDSSFEHPEDSEQQNDTLLELPLDDDDLYGCLNISRTATAEEITAAYRRWSRIYHPDKHHDAEYKQKAELLFGRIKKAHEILADPSRRAIYDTIGLTGLEEGGRELVERYQTPQEIREAYERLNREKAEREIERKTNPKGTMTVHVNAAEIFNPYDDYQDPLNLEDLPFVELTGFNISQSIEAPMTAIDTMLLSGNVNVDNGRGSGSVNCGVRRILTERAWGEVEVGGSTSGLDFGFKGFSHFGKRYFANLNVLCRTSPNGNLKPGAVLAVGNQLDEHTVGTLTWRNGSITTALIRNNGITRWGLTLQLGIPHSFVMISASHSIQDTKIRANIKGGTFGGLFEYGVERKISQLSTVGATMIVGIPHGVMLRLKFVRANQTYLFPIKLSDELVPAAIFYGTVVPLIAFMTVHKLIIEPYQNDKKRKEKEKTRASYGAKLNEKREEAAAAVALMSITYARNKAEEELKNGLVITNAMYGRLIVGAGEPEASESEVINVTIQVQCLVQDSKLILHPGTKSSLPGFYDPAPGELKTLMVHYLFQNEEHEIVIQDEEKLKIPKPAHILRV